MCRAENPDDALRVRVSIPMLTAHHLPALGFNYTLEELQVSIILLRDCNKAAGGFLDAKESEFQYHITR